MPPVVDGANCPDGEIVERTLLTEGNDKSITVAEFGKNHGTLGPIPMFPNTGTC